MPSCESDAEPRLFSPNRDTLCSASRTWTCMHVHHCYCWGMEHALQGNNGVLCQDASCCSACDIPLEVCPIQSGRSRLFRCPLHCSSGVLLAPVRLGC